MSRGYERFPCARTVSVAFFKGKVRLGAQSGIVRDISEGGLLLEFDATPPLADRVLVRTDQDVVQYEVCHVRKTALGTLLGVRCCKSLARDIKAQTL